MKPIITLISAFSAVVAITSCSLLGPSAPEIQRLAAYNISTQTGVTQGHAAGG